MPSYTDQQSRMETAFRHICSLCSIQCGCGRTHFTSASGHGDYEPGELEALIEKAKAQPDKYVEHDDFDHIDGIYIDGQTIVPDCQCGRADRFARFIERHAEGLALYLVKFLGDRAKRLEEQAKGAREVSEALAAAACADERQREAVGA